MPLFFLRMLFLAIAASGLFFPASAATQLTLNINVDIDGRRFLLTNQQKIAIALSNPLSEGDTAIVVALAFQPAADLTQIVFDSDVAVYVSYWPVPAFGIINIERQVNAAYGQAYSFNGAQIVGGNAGAGLDGYVSIYFNAPLSSTQPVVTGLAWHIYDKFGYELTALLPINYYTLNRFETRVIPKPKPTVWVFVASDISNGSVLPVNILNPLPDSAQAFKTGTSAAEPAFAPQLGNYLSVNLEAQEQATIHFELLKNAFAYGPYPNQ